MLRTAFAILLGMATLAVFSPRALAQQAEKKSDEIKIELLEKGKAPLRELRFTPKAGDKSTLVFGMKMSQAIKIGGLPPQRPDMPEQQMFIDVETKKVDSNGDIDFVYSYKDIKILGDSKSPIVSTTEQMMKPLVGATGSITMNNRGVAKKSDFKVPTGLDAMAKSLIEGMKDSINKASTPVPEDAIGIGGKWKCVQEIKVNGIQLTQTIVSEVTELSSSGYSVKTTISQSAAAQEVKNEMLPPGTSLKLESLKSDGSGNSSYTFGRMFPVSSSVKLNSMTAMKVSIAGQTQEMSTDMDMDMTVNEIAK